MFDKNNLLLRTNYSGRLADSTVFRDTLKRFDIPTDSAFKIFPRRRIWLGNNTSDGPGYTGYIGGEYDLYETGRIIDTEAFVAQAFRNKHTLLFKEGYEIMCDDQRNLKYIKKRLAEMEYVSNVKWNKFLKEVALNLINTHNCYVLKIRKNNSSSGQRRKWKGAGNIIDPIAGYFVLPSESIEVRCDQYGTIEEYRQNMRGYFIEFDPRDIIHLHYYKRTGYTMAAPPLEAVKDDILALRKIEESVESLIYKALFPIIHVKIGTEQNPAKVLPDGISEVSVATRLLDEINDTGGIATSERVEVNMIGAESQALRVEAYLKYFKQRVYTGLGVSSLDLGDIESSGAASADFLDARLKTSIAAYQAEIEDMVEKDIFDELLLESGRYEHTFEIDEEDHVKLKFHEVDVDAKIAKENHTINKANSDLLTTNEARGEMKRKPLKDEEHDDLHMRNMEQRNAKDEHSRNKNLATHEAHLVPPSTTTAVTKKATNGASTTTKVTKTGTAKSQPTKKSGSGKAAKAATKPKNQHSKDWLIGKVYETLSSKVEDKEAVLTKHMADYLLANATLGLVNPKDENSMELVDFREPAEEIVEDVVLDLLELSEQKLEHPVLFSRKRDIIISHAIDKAEDCVNNMING